MDSFHDAPSYDDGFDHLTGHTIHLRVLSHLEPEQFQSARKPSLSEYDGDVAE